MSASVAGAGTGAGSTGGDAVSPRRSTVVGIGLLGGLGSGLFGIGGGLVMIPAMVLGAAIRQHEAHASSLAAVVPIATASAIPFLLSGSVDVPTGVVLASTAVIGSQIGSAIMARLSETQLRTAFAVLVILVALRFIFGVEPAPSGFSGVGSFPNLLFALAIGGAAGLASALFGIGGGLVIVPLLVLGIGMPQHLAQGTSLLAIIPTAIAGSYAHARRGYLRYSLAVPLAAGGIVGGLVASTVALRLDPIVLQRGFSIVLVLAAWRMIRR